MNARKEVLHVPRMQTASTHTALTDAPARLVSSEMAILVTVSKKYQQIM